MKPIILILLLFCSVSSFAQQYRKFLFAIDVGSPKSHLHPLGCFSMEPGYRVSDRILVGFRMEQIGFLTTTGGKDNSLGSMGINGHYYFSLSSTRLFCGAGIGLYNPSNNFIMNNTDNLSQRNGLGVYPRIGLELGHMRLMMEYNFIQKMNDYIFVDVPGYSHYEMVDKSYFAFKIGFFIGGGKRKN